jgi:hypothetical protein
MWSRLSSPDQVLRLSIQSRRSQCASLPQFELDHRGSFADARETPPAGSCFLKNANLR